MNSGYVAPPVDRGPLAFACRLQRAGRYAEAEAAFAAHLLVHPTDPAALAVAGAAALEAGHPPLAVNRFKKLAALEPASAEARSVLGQALTRAGSAAHAIFHLERALQLDPEHPRGYFHLGVAFERAGERAAAISAYERALVLDPQCADAAAHLGAVFNRRGDTVRARSAFAHALAIEPTQVAARTGRALASAIEGDLEDARAALEAMRTEQPNFAGYWSALGRLRAWSGDLSGAEAAYRKALSLDVDDDEARLGIATSLLAQGRYADGWRAHEDRPDGRYGAARRFPNLPVWNGGRLKGNLLLLCDGDLSDAIQFARLISEARARVRDVVLLADGDSAPLAPLLATAAGCGHVLTNAALVEALEQPPAARSALASLPYLLGTTPEKLPGPMPYLAAPADRAAQWRSRLAVLPRPRVGLVWTAHGDRGTPSRHKSLPPAALAPLVSMPGVAFASLNLGAPRGRAPFGPLEARIADLSTEIRDFGDTAAVIAELDLVISVDTPVAHVAGALGKPVWLLDRFHTGWQWRLGANGSPWYPSLRIFRQHRFLDWSIPLDYAEAALRRFIADAAPA
jgi:Flp pilus assembly protein TadD